MIKFFNKYLVGNWAWECYFNDWQLNSLSDELKSYLQINLEPRGINLNGNQPSGYYVARGVGSRPPERLIYLISKELNCFEHIDCSDGKSIVWSTHYDADGNSYDDKGNLYKGRPVICKTSEVMNFFHCDLQFTEVVKRSIDYD